MAFQSLYRKHRPQSFAELVGQDAVSNALRNAVREGRLGHAYLFSGPRGTGKTTTARLLAKALNCAQRGDDGEPCNACPSCVEITAGTSMDVLELDAASNNKVDEMRALLERVAYRSAGGAAKVYIIDEVHMLSGGAEAALLKTLEEPPDHVVFVLATTDPQKVAATIRSRTQHFGFTLLPTDLLAAHLAEVAGREGIDADPAILAVIARRAGGSARDALSLLDQALAHGDGRLVPDQVRALLGGTPFSERSAILEALAARDVPGLLAHLDVLLGAGVDARQLADDLLRHLREAFLLASTRGRARLEAPEEERARLQAQAGSLGASGLVRALERLGEAAVEIRRAPDPRLVLEVALVRLARADSPGADSGVEALAERVGRLEQLVSELRAALSGGGAPPPGPQSAPRPAPDAAKTRPGPRMALGALAGATPPPTSPPPALPAPAAVAAQPAVPTREPAGGPGDAPLELDDVILAWPNALSGFKPRLKAMAKEAQPVRVEGSTVVLGLPTKFQAHHLPSITAEAPTVAGALATELGRPVRVSVVVDDSLSLTGEASAAPVEDDDGAPDHGRVDSPLDLVIETFGATVESEIVHE
jgi:DNA polymerase-3 subunit gamma/tau